MFNIILFFTLILSFIFLLIGTIIFLRNSESSINRLFLLLSFNLAIWLIANYLAGTNKINNELSLLANRVTFLFGGLSILSILLFIKKLININFKIKDHIYIIINLSILSLSITPLVVESVYFNGDLYEIRFGILAELYFITVIVSAVLALAYAVMGSVKSSGILKIQINIILLSFAFSLLGVMCVNLFLPFVFRIYALTDVGSFFSFFVILGSSYAIIKHKLFDIRLTIARTLGYVLSISALGLIYGFITFNLISELLFGSSVLTVWQRTIYTMLAVLVAFTFQPLKKFFDKWSSKLFYQDAYDGQELIDELNRCLVSTIDLQKLLSESSGIITKYLKPEYCVFGLRETDQQGKRLLGSSKIKFSNDDFKFASEILPKIPQKIIIADSLETSLVELKKRMRKNDVAVFARLTNDVYKQGVGAIVLGPKKSGNAYNSQDIKVLEIVANTMIIAIQNALRFEEIQKFNVTLEKKVVDATAKLKRANEKLILLDNTKDDFISMASHQLRTPLTSIKGYASMMIEGDGGVPLNKTEKKFMRQILFSSQQMVGLIGDLLNLSRLNSGKFSLQLGETHIQDIVLNQIDQLRTIADEKKINFVVRVDKKLPKIIVDENKIQQVVMNMIDNAIYYTPEAGEIIVSLQKIGKKIEFKVKDSGIGVPKYDQAKLFTRYFRAENAKKFRPNGTGIGLYMAKKAVVEHKGAIIFNSKENQGSTFGFSIPI